MTEKPYPEWVCYECGLKYGKHVGLDRVVSYHLNQCGVCGKVCSVTEPRDFGHLKDGWEHEPQRD
jgi:hypothetical protein